MAGRHTADVPTPSLNYGALRVEGRERGSNIHHATAHPKRVVLAVCVRPNLAMDAGGFTNKTVVGTAGY